jgi:type IV secretion system protein VirB9
MSGTPANVAAVCAGLSLSLLVGSVSAGVIPSRGKQDPRIRSVIYDPAQVYELHGYVGFSIELEFEADEHFEGHGGGDLEAIAIAAHTNHVILKPRAQQVLTNFVIYTDRRAYRFDYSVEARAPDLPVDEIVYAVRFEYPDAIAAHDLARAKSQAIDSELKGGSAARSQNWNYWFCGHRAVRPTGVFDDGVHTHLSFGRRAELPAIFVLNDDGSESLLNLNVEHGDIVVHRVARRLIVRRGRSTGCIVNRSFDGGGERLDSGTVAPNIMRERLP